MKSSVAGMRRRLFAHLETWRPYTSAYVGFVGLAGASLASSDPAGWRWVGAWAAPTLGWLAGLYGGDYFDRELDAIAKPYRPIPSGRMRPRTALAGMVVCVLAGAAIALLLNWRTILLVGLALVTGISYNAWFKARGLSGNMARGSLTSFAFLFGAMATAPYPKLELLPVALLFSFHDAGSNLVGTLRDLDGDRRGGYQTLAVRRGVRAALGCAACCYALWLTIALSLPALLREPRDVAAYLALLFGAAAMGLAALVMLVRAGSPSRRLALRAHEVLVVERIVLAGALLALGAGAAFALPLVTAGVVLTWLTQHWMRERYEFALPEGALDLGNP